MKQIETEIIATNISDIKIINKSMAHRIELIERLDLGGVTPSQELINLASQIATLPFNVMLRPHANSFIYDKNDELTILKQLDYIRDHSNANGVVFGSLNNTNLINLKQLELIIRHKGHLSLTFHRAIDASKNVVDSYRELTNYNEINLVLTSGGKKSALDGINNIKSMLTIEPDDHCKILCGAGINHKNIKQFIKKSNAQKIHIGSSVRSNDLVNHDLLNQMLNLINPSTYF